MRGGVTRFVTLLFLRVSDWRVGAWGRRFVVPGSGGWSGVQQVFDSVVGGANLLGIYM